MFWFKIIYHIIIVWFPYVIVTTDFLYTITYWLDPILMWISKLNLSFMYMMIYNATMVLFEILHFDYTLYP